MLSWQLPSDDRKAFEKAEALFAPNSNFAALLEHMRTLPMYAISRFSDNMFKFFFKKIVRLRCCLIWECT